MNQDVDLMPDEVVKTMLAVWEQIDALNKLVASFEAPHAATKVSSSMVRNADALMRRAEKLTLLEAESLLKRATLERIVLGQIHDRSNAFRLFMQAVNRTGSVQEAMRDPIGSHFYGIYATPFDSEMFEACVLAGSLN